MPFGHDCEHANFDACVRMMRGKVKNPSGYCAALMRETEDMCKQHKMQATLPEPFWRELLVWWL